MKYILISLLILIILILAYFKLDLISILAFLQDIILKIEKTTFEYFR